MIETIVDEAMAELRRAEFQRDQAHHLFVAASPRERTVMHKQWVLACERVERCRLAVEDALDSERDTVDPDEAYELRWETGR